MSIGSVFVNLVLVLFCLDWISDAVLVLILCSTYCIILIVKLTIIVCWRVDY